MDTTLHHCPLTQCCLSYALQLSQLDTQRVWQQSFTVWCDALRRKVKVVQVRGACVQDWA